MLRLTLSLTFVALGTAFSNTPHTGCNDAAPEVVQALAVEQGYAPHLVKSCEDIMAAGGCSTLKNNGYSEICCASCAPIHDRVHGGDEMRGSRGKTIGRE